MLVAYISLVIIISILLGSLGVASRNVVGALIVIQSLYWLVSYAVRPTFLAAFQPTPVVNDAIADTRLWAFGYSEPLTLIMPLVLGGVLVYLVVVLIGATILRARLRSDRRYVLEDYTPIYTLLCVGWIARVISHFLPNATIETAGVLAAVAVGVLVLFVDDLGVSKLTLCIGSELTWSVLSASKAPILAVITWLLIRQFLRGRRPSPKFIGLLTIGALASFLAIQRVKQAVGAFAAASASPGQYPVGTNIILPVIGRFDLLSAVTDAYFAGGRSWLGLRSLSTLFLEKLVPFNSAPSSGADWAYYVRAQSRGYTDTGVHLAQGPVAEGWVVGGWFGLAIESAGLAIAMLLVAWGLHSCQSLAVAFSVAMTSQPYLYERGMLGLAEGISKSVELALVVAAFFWILPQVRPQSAEFVKRSAGGPLARRRANAQPATNEKTKSQTSR